MYSLHNYGTMMADRVRMKTYAAAIESVLRPGDRVLDLGAGTGIFSLLAARLGAGRVIAIEPNEAACQVGKELARLNGCSERIEWHAKRCQEVKLDEPVDLIVADLRGALPFIGDHFASIADARDRLLRPGGILLPVRDRLSVALASSAKAWKGRVTPWLNGNLGFDFSPASERLWNQWSLTPFTPEEILSEPAQWHEIDYQTVKSPEARNMVTLEASGSGEAHGFWLWFDAEIALGIGFSSAPGADAPEVYGRAFFPWPQAVALDTGDRVQLDISVQQLNGQPFWRWRTRFETKAPSPGPWDQNTFLGMAPDPSSLRRRGDHYKPSANADGRILKRLLELMDGERSNHEIATVLQKEWPERFKQHADAFDFVGERTAKFSV